jgi:hemolysin activation/secretion protein
MKKILAALIVAASLVAYFVVGDMFAPDAPVAVPSIQEPASSPEQELAASAADEPEQPASQAAVQPVMEPSPVFTPEASPLKRVLAPKPVQVQPEVAKTEPSPSQEMRLMVREIKFEGVTAFSDNELQQVVQEFVGQELSVEQAFAIPARVSGYYQSKNMVARATLVGSLARNGVLKVGVIETQVSQTQLNQQLSTVAAAEKPMVLEPVGSSQVAQLEVKDQVAVPVQATLPVEAAPALPVKDQLSQDEETALIFKHYAKKSRQYELLMDNQGLEGTGATRMGLGLAWNDALGQGNTLSVQGLKSKGSQFVQAAFAWATGVEGLKLGARVSDLSYDVVDAVQTATYVSGEAVKKGLFLAYELVNTPAEYSTLGLRYDTAQLRNHSLNANDSAFYDTRSMGIEFKGFEREMAPGGAVFTYDLRLSKGEVDMNGSPNEQADLSGEKTDGEYSKLKFSGTILQPLGGINAAYFGLTLQRANKNLDASEKLYLGGPLGVRAYGVGEGAGSQGEIANFELRQRLSAKTTLAEFYDVGRIRSWENAGVSQRGGTLSGFGLSLSHKLDSDINLKATWARTTGDTPDSSIMPVKSNGEYDRNRFWLSLDARF